MIKLSWCDNCKHCHGLKGWLPACDAFPDCVPVDFVNDGPEEPKVCNNGIGYEPKGENK